MARYCGVRNTCQHYGMLIGAKQKYWRCVLIIMKLYPSIATQSTDLRRGDKEHLVIHSCHAAYIIRTIIHGHQWACKLYFEQELFHSGFLIDVAGHSYLSELDHMGVHEISMIDDFAGDIFCHLQVI